MSTRETRIAVVERDDHLAVHAYCISRESAQRWIDNVAADMARGRHIFTNKSLTPESFEIVEKVIR